MIKLNLMLISFILFFSQVSFAQDLIKLPDNKPAKSQGSLLVLPENDALKSGDVNKESVASDEIVEQKKTPQGNPDQEKTKKGDAEKKPSESSSENNSTSDNLKVDPKKQNSSNAEPQQEAVIEKKELINNEKIMVLRAQKPLPKFYSILSKNDYRSTVLNTLSVLAQVDCKIVAFDTDYGFILFDTTDNRYLVTIFEFNHHHWVKILPMNKDFSDDKVFGKVLEILKTT